MTVTDRRVLVVDAADEHTLDPDAGSIAYSDLASVTVENQRIDLTTTDGVTWQFRLPDANPEVVDAVVRHLTWVGEFRSRLLSCRNDVELAAGQIREDAAEMNWEEAERTYESVREPLDRLICAAQWTKPIADDDLAPELTTIERTLEEAHARLYIERSESMLDLSRQLIINEDYDLGGKPLRQARQFYERARAQADAVERGDAFQFGTQRDLQEDLKSLAWEIDTVAAEPIRQAHEAEIAADTATDVAERIDYLETAFRRYEQVLELNWGEGRTDYAGDASDAREGMELAATRLVDLYTRLARERWDAGIDQYDPPGEVKAPLRTCLEAYENLERALELARQFVPREVKDIEKRLTGMDRQLATMRQRPGVPTDEDAPDPEVDQVEGTATNGETADADTDDTGETTDASAGEDTPSLDSLHQLDTHHEVTLDPTGDRFQHETAGNGHRQEPTSPESE